MMRETFEAVLALGAQALPALVEVCRRDSGHLARQMTGSDNMSGRALKLVGPGPRPDLTA